MLPPSVSHKLLKEQLESSRNLPCIRHCDRCFMYVVSFHPLTALGVDSFHSPILHMRKLRHRGLKELAQVHRASSR